MSQNSREKKKTCQAITRSRGINPGKKCGKRADEIKMAARQGNTSQSRKTSMAEELLTLVSNEEYINTIPMFGGTDYVNSTELASLKKMISG